jgi:hypothetical protein
MSVKNVGAMIEPQQGGYASFDTFATFQMKAYPGEYLVDEVYTPIHHNQAPAITLDRLHIAFNQTMLDHACILEIS